MKTSFKVSLVLVALALSACGKNKEDLLSKGLSPAPQAEAKPTPYPVDPTPAPNMVTDSAKVQNEYESGKVDVLFVIDNSASMKAHQDRLVSNINKFAEAFLNNSDVDFHVGVVKVYDSKTYASTVPNGELHGGFVKRGTNTIAELQAILKVGVLDLANGGPQFEEVFSPIKAALSEDMANGANAGFYRSDAHLAVIMITDANDDSVNFDETNLQAFLDQLKKGRSEKYSTYAVLANASDEGVACKTDPSGAPDRINNFIKITNGKKFSLCDRDYGKKLARVGSEITAKAVFNRVVELTNVPDLRHPMVVTCEGKEIPKGSAGYSFAGYKVELSRAYQGCKSTAAVIEVTYAVLSSENIDLQ